MADDNKPYRVGKTGPTKKTRFNATEYAADFIKEAIDFQLTVMRDETRDDKHRLMAAQAIINRGAGRETQKVEVNSTHTEEKKITFEANSISLEARKELLAARRNGDILEAEITEIEEVKELEYVPETKNAKD